MVGMFEGNKKDTKWNAVIDFGKTQMGNYLLQVL